MIIDTSALAKDEQVYLELEQLYKSAGYTKFKMRKFEEYSLYLENKSFLASENVITFNAPDGKLLALKPDVTLSIVKNAAAEKGDEKVYYRESVYRLDSKTGEFKEINQLGLECIGEVDTAQTLEICTLALESLNAIDSRFVFSVSDMQFITALADGLNTESKSAKKRILNCLLKRSAHEVFAVAEEYGIKKEYAEKIAEIIAAPTDFPSALRCARSVADSEEAKAAVAELETLYAYFSNGRFKDKIRLDFSILNDINYYNGIIFQGYAEGYPRVLLSGGRYDKLLEKFKRKTGAMGFALSLDELNGFYKKPSRDTADMLVLYSDKTAQKALEYAQSERLNGVSVYLAKSVPAGSSFLKVVNLQTAQQREQM
jgi:ATP phosphoribosyltransferase regulatory subunit